MRSELVFVAAAVTSNRYLLTLVASKATRRMHRPDARLEDTSNVVLQLCGRRNPIVGARYFGQVNRTTDKSD
jgi:hypothetical protein